MSDGAMSKEDMEKVLEDSWVAYQDEKWDELGKALHPLVVWHDGHSEGHEAQPFKDHPTKDVLAHFKDCRNKGPYKVPERKLVKVLGPDLAVVFDEISGPGGHKHGCVDVYRFEGGQIREMWTCVTEPGSEPVHFRESSATQGGSTAS